jgi:hypothetical protein
MLPIVRRFAALASILAPACGGAGEAVAGDTDGTESATTSFTAGPTTAPADSSGDASSDGSSGDTEAAPLSVIVEAFTYPTQPMVVDLALRADVPLVASVAHLDDPGVLVAPLVGPDDDVWFRVRGLLPGAMHTLSWQAQADGFATAEGTLDIVTEPALPGFAEAFAVEGDGPAHPGYLMFDLLRLPGPAPSGLFVIDAQGRTRWYLGVADDVAGPAVVFAAAQLRRDGTLLYVRDDTLFIRDELGAELLAITDDELGIVGLHHDVVELPGGNFLALAFTFRDIDYPDLGLTHVAGDLIVEITPAGEVVWQWDSFDHLDPQRRRDGFDAIVYDPIAGVDAKDWTHGNAIVHEPRTDSVLLSLRHQDWIVRIDRQSGEVLWRFGDEGDFALGAGTWPFHQHSPQWQADGTLLLYDNGVGNPGLPDDQEFSRAVRYAIDAGATTATQVWEDQAEDFTAVFAGDADRLPNGNLLVTDSSIGLFAGNLHARVRQIDEADSAVPLWSITTEIGTFVYRTTAWDRLPGVPAR